MEQLRRITAADDAALADIARRNLEALSLNIPGTAYFDPELDSLSRFYKEKPEKRAYFVAESNGEVLGGAGLAEFPGLPDCAELQKLYLSDAAKGRGLGRRLVEAVEVEARRLGYRLLYLETHSNMTAAIRLYEKLGFRRIEKPRAVQHGTMNRFYCKELSAPETEMKL